MRAMWEYTWPVGTRYYRAHQGNNHYSALRITTRLNKIKVTKLQY
jgi:hypothetical protein